MEDLIQFWQLNEEARERTKMKAKVRRVFHVEVKFAQAVDKGAGIEEHRKPIVKIRAWRTIENSVVRRKELKEAYFKDLKGMGGK